MQKRNSGLHVARKSTTDAVKAEADRYAANVLPIIREAQRAGARTLREMRHSTPHGLPRLAWANGTLSQSRTFPHGVGRLCAPVT